MTGNNISWSGDKKLLNQLIEFYSKTKDERTLSGNVLIQKSNSRQDGTFDENTHTSIFIKSDSNAQVVLQAKGIIFPLDKQQNGGFNAKSSQKDNYELFGTIIKIESRQGVALRSDTTTGNWNAGMYIPKPLVITSFNGAEQISKNTGKIVSWVPDNNPASSKGVIVRLRYDPIIEKSFPNTESLPIESIERYITVSDNGNYHITNDDLRGFPAPLHGLEISIFRGNFQVSEGSFPVALCAFDYFKSHVQLTN